MRYVARVGERECVIDLGENGEHPRVTLDGRELAVEVHPVGATPAAEPTPEHAAHFGLIAGTRSHDVFVRPVAEGEAEAGALTFEVSLGGRTFTVSVQDERTRTLIGLAGEGHVSGEAVLRAPMPGLVSNVLAAEGATIQRGQTVVVLEAMKMENDLASPRTGVVKQLRVAKGQTVNQGDVLAVIGDGAGIAASDDVESAQ